MPPTVFISYSHKDEAWKDRLVTHLAGLERDGRLRTWNDRAIRAGQSWFQKIEEAMQEARVAVLLVSPNFLASKFIQTREVPLLLERRAREGVHVVPVIVKDCLWEEEVRIADLQARPLDGRPLASYRSDKRDTELKKIAREILGLLGDDALPQTAPETKDEPSPPRPTTLAALHQLPPPPADFTGRETDLAELRAAVESGGVTISGVRGMGGIGKTALALKLAQELELHYPDAQIYLDLQGVSANPVSPTQAMGYVIRSFYPDVRLPESEVEIAALYRSALHGRRALLLMDNAAGADQVRPLIPPQGCLLLVTSRFSFHLPGFEVKDLGEMPSADARALLLRIAPRIGDQVGQIAEVCAGIPFALRQAAGTLSERPDLSPASYASRLASGKGQLGLIEASLRLSYDLLPEELACRWRSLAIFSADFDIMAAGRIWDLEPDAAEAILGDLVRWSLVDGQNARYRLHDLSRVFAKSRLAEPECIQAGRRHSEYYLELTARAAQTFFGTTAKEAMIDSLNTFDREWKNIESGFTWALENADRHTRIAKVAILYPQTLQPFFGIRLGATDKLASIEAALEVARRLGTPEEQSVIWNLLGLTKKSAGRLPEAISHYRQALELAAEIDNTVLQALILGNLGVVFNFMGHPLQAIAHLQKSLELGRSLKNDNVISLALGGLGIAYSGLGNHHKAITFYKNWLAVVRKLGNQHSEAMALGNLGVQYSEIGKHEKARKYFEENLAKARELRDEYGEAAALGNLGRAYFDLGDIDKAKNFLERRIELSRRLDDRRGESESCWNLGLLFESQGDLLRAIEFLRIRLEYEREIGHSQIEETSAYICQVRDRLS